MKEEREAKDQREDNNWDTIERINYRRWNYEKISDCQYCNEKEHVSVNWQFSRHKKCAERNINYDSVMKTWKLKISWARFFRNIKSQ